MTWEQRWHPLWEEWVMVATHRGDRPWSGRKTVVERSEALHQAPTDGRVHEGAS